jgi:hypothetical protein
MAVSPMRIVISLLIASLLLTASGVGTATVAGVDQDCLDPKSSGQCDADSVVEIRGVLDALFEVVYTTLKFASFTTAAIGAILWFTASRNSERAQNGLWIFVGGILMVGFYFVFTLFLGLLSWISTN